MVMGTTENSLIASSVSAAKDAGLSGENED